jgi:hypothetical protein
MSMMDQRITERAQRVGSRTMVDEMMVSAARALVAKAAERAWMVQQAADHRGQTTFSAGRLRHFMSRTLIRAGLRLQGASGATSAGVLLTCRLASAR